MSESPVTVTTKTDFVRVLANQHQESFVDVLKSRRPRLKSFHYCKFQKVIRKTLFPYFCVIYADGY